jgi:hypothetical protein
LLGSRVGGRVVDVVDSLEPESRVWHMLDHMRILTVLLDTLEFRRDLLDGLPSLRSDYPEKL